MRKLIALLLCFVFVFSGCGGTGLQESESTSSVLVNVRDVISFGPYEWIVLAKEGDKALLITKETIACKPYHTSYTGVCWEICTLRSWLNSSFLGEFSAADQAKIQTTTNSNPNNSEYGTTGGNTTSDKVFLLSIDEARTYFVSDSARICYPNATAQSQGGYSSPDGACWWWLRSPGSNSSYAAYICGDGSVFERGGPVDDDNNAVRPAMWVNLGS